MQCATVQISGSCIQPLLSYAHVVIREPTMRARKEQPSRNLPGKSGGSVKNHFELTGCRSMSIGHKPVHLVRGESRSLPM